MAHSGSYKLPKNIFHFILSRCGSKPCQISVKNALKTDTVQEKSEKDLHYGPNSRKVQYNFFFSETPFWNASGVPKFNPPLLDPPKKLSPLLFPFSFLIGLPDYPKWKKKSYDALQFMRNWWCHLNYYLCFSVEKIVNAFYDFFGIFFFRDGLEMMDFSLVSVVIWISRWSIISECSLATH